MAFTIAHFAAALPFYGRHRWLNFDAILMGTIVPDLPYYTPYILGGGRELAHQSHQWLGLFSYSLPVGLIVFTIWCWLIKPALYALVLPWFEAKFLTPDSSNRGVFKKTIGHPLGVEFWFVIVVSLVVGASTHLIWDGITHPDGFIAEKVSILQYGISVPYLGSMAVARVLQYVTSIVGMGMLFRFAWRHSISSPFKDSDTYKSSYISLSTGYSRNYDYLETNYNSLNKFEPIKFNRIHSILLLIMICLMPLIWSIFAIFKWSDIFLVDNYDFFVYFFMGFIRQIGVTLSLYVIGYHIVNLIRLSYFYTHKRVTDR